MRTIHVNPGTVAAPMGPYSHAVRTETADATWIHVAGQIALDAEGNLVGPGDLAAQAEQVFANLGAILESNGAAFGDVVKIQTFATSLEDLAAVREVAARHLAPEPPASTLVHVVGLVRPEAMIEVDLVAVIPLSRSS